MRFFIISFFLAVIPVSSEMRAQMIISYVLDTPEFFLTPVNTDKYETLDSCYLTLSYSFRSRLYEKDDSLNNVDLMELQLGNRYNAFFSRNLRDLDIANTKDMKENMTFSYIPKEYMGWDILVDNTERKEWVSTRLPFTDQVVEYEEKVPELRFFPTEETDTVLGYFCKSALCSYGGREWKIYYTEEIPLPFGPWKLNGASGLILKALDTENNFVFEAVGLTQQPNPLIRYDWKRKRMEKEEWKEFERDMYKNAGAFLRSTRVRVSIADDSERGYHRLREDWSEYYNPLER